MFSQDTESYPTPKNYSLGFFNYKGMLVEQLLGEYRWGGEIFKTLPDIDKKVKEISDAINKR